MVSVLRQLLSILLLPGVVAGLVPFLLSRSVDAPLHGNVYFFLGLVLLFPAVYLFTLCILHFHKIGKGTLAPWDATTNLVVEGPYKLIRNPMITAVLGILTAEVFLYKSWAILIWTLVFFIISHIYFIAIEEVALENKFGQPYVDYKKAVPRWFPRLF